MSSKENGRNNNTTRDIKTFNAKKEEYFEENYDVMTGVRTAGTLGGFFLLVLLILLYKSKCKKRSRVATPIMEAIAQEAGLLDSPKAIYDHRRLSRCLDQLNPLAELSNYGLYRDCEPPILLTAPPRDSPPASSSSSSETELREKIHMSWIQPTIDIHMTTLPGLFLYDDIKYMDDSSSEHIPYGELDSPSPPPHHHSTNSWSYYEESRSTHDSELEFLSDYLETRRRSSSTQTTFADLQQSLHLSLTTPNNSKQQRETKKIKAQMDQCESVLGEGRR